MHSILWTVPNQNRPIVVGTEIPQEYISLMSPRGRSRNPAFMPATSCHGDLAEVGSAQEHKRQLGNCAERLGENFMEMGHSDCEP